MAWDGVPWFVESTAASEETLRLVVEAAAGGGEGIIGPADLLVTALDVPGTSVEVGIGAMVARKRGGAVGQAYAARMPTPETVDIAATGADGPRSDLIIARVEDPFGGENWPQPEDPTVGPYVFTRVLTDVPPGTRSVQDVLPGSTAVTLARVDVPASTSIITPVMVTDLRQIAAPRTQTSRRYLHSAWATPDDVGPVVDVWEDFPLGARWQERIPEWATHVEVHADLTGLLHPDTTEARGTLRVILDEQFGAPIPFLTTHAGRHSAVAGNRFAIAPEDRGQILPIAVQGKGTAGKTGVLRADDGTVLTLEVTYSQAPVIA
ncbi:hypothetical protein ACIP9H_33650 [Streptomyces sp. NPDC088732]|uniref:hypothetical protein n=1 Tax=Streptomyces sp. NPDC088732 TaxID=3365879 RepID=UPI0037F6BB08